MNRSRLVRRALPLVVIVLAGCLGVISDTPDVESELEDAEPPDELTATIETTVTVDNETTTVTEDVWLRADGTSRSESEWNGTTHVTVNDGEQLWIHDTADNEVTVRDNDGVGSRTLEETYDSQRDLFDEFEINETTETTVEGYDAYHVVLDPKSNDSVGQSVDVLIGDTVYAIPVGSDSDEPTGDGEPAFADEPDRIELWLDTEYLFPIQYQFETTESSFEMTYTDLEFEPEPPIDDDRFEFEVPENATVDEVEVPTFDELDDIEAADDAVEFDVVEPSVPEGYELDDVTLVTYDEADRDRVMLTYTDEAGTHLTVEFDSDPAQFEREGESVEIGDTTGSYDRIEAPGTDIHNVAWADDGVGYYVGATVDIDRETLIEIADNIHSAG